MVKNTHTFTAEIKSSKVPFRSEPKPVELEPDEAEMYSLLFQSEIGSPITVKKPLQRCLKKFVEAGLLEDDYYKFVELCHQAMENQFDAVKKDGLHVMNNEGDVSLICADVKGEWEVVCTINRGTVQKFYKHKNFSSFTGIGLNQTTNVQYSRKGTNSSSGSFYKDFWL